MVSLGLSLLYPEFGALARQTHELTKGEQMQLKLISKTEKISA